LGGVEWGGGALDPTTNTYVVNSNVVPQIYTLVPRAEADKKYGNALRAKDGYAAQQGSAYGFKLENFLNMWGMPCWAPPYGTLSSYDMNTGKLNWKKPFGRGPEVGLLHARQLGFDHHRCARDHQVGPDLHRCFDGQPRARHRHEDRQCAVEAHR
jgi:quinoprotein glucose dehydrogenase